MHVVPALKNNNRQRLCVSLNTHQLKCEPSCELEFGIILATGLCLRIRDEDRKTRNVKAQFAQVKVSVENCGPETYSQNLSMARISRESSS